MLVERMEGGVGVPGFVKVQKIDGTAYFLGNLLGVVAKAVIGGVGHHRNAQLGAILHGLCGERHLCDTRLHGLGRELVFADRPDDTVRISARREVHGNGPRHDQRVQQRLVAIAVHKHHIAARYRAMPDDLVGRGGAVGHEEGMVGAEVSGGVGLCLPYGAAVVEEGAQFGYRDREIAAQGVFTIVLVEGPAHRRFGEGHAARMPRCIPGVVGLGRVLDQCLEEGR
ncbi:hypothetical protein D3C72_1304990 [compost metagenome]